jgi:hypothetical protein
VTSDQTATVHGDEQLMVRAGHLFDSLREEFVCASHDLETWSQPRARQAVAARVQDGDPRLPGVRKLLSPAALADEAQLAHLRRVAAAGGQVRITSAPLPHETMILDRRVVILAGPHSPRGREYTVSTSPGLVGGVYTLFSAAWEAAATLASYLPRDVPELDQAILAALGAGLTDEAAARQLGTSLRTYRRRVAELMAGLDAGSRFQAGLRAGELGLTR